MKRALGVAAVLVLGAAQAQASEVKPTDVKFEDGAIAMSLTGVAGDVEAGAKIMNKGAGNCVACHMIEDQSQLAFQGEIGPMLDGAGDRWSEAELRGIVANAKMMFEGTMMPSFYKTEGFIRLGNGYTGKSHEGDVAPLLTAQEIEDVVAYLMTLKYE